MLEKRSGGLGIVEKRRDDHETAQFNRFQPACLLRELHNLGFVGAGFSFLLAEIYLKEDWQSIAAANRSLIEFLGKTQGIGRMNPVEKFPGGLSLVRLKVANHVPGNGQIRKGWPLGL